MQEKYTRYDKEEARNNDEKTHDNPNHSSGHSNERDLEDAKDRQTETDEDES
jgi:hypothetical protein